MIIFENLKIDDILTLAKNVYKDNYTVVLLKDVDFNAQLYLKNDEEAYRLVKIIDTCGGVVNRSDLVDIIYNKNKNIYSTIRKLIDYKLLKTDSRRDSNLFLTANSLSILRARKVKNGVDFSKASETQIAKSKLILNLIKDKRDMFYSESDFLQVIIDYIETRDLVPVGKENDYMTLVRDKGFNYYSKILKLNCYLSKDATAIAMYAKNSYDLNKKFKELLKMDMRNKFGGLDINKIIVLTLDDFDYQKTRNTLIQLHQEYMNENPKSKGLSSSIFNLKLEILN